MDGRTIHFLEGAKVVLAIFEANKAIAFGLAGVSVLDYTRLLK